MAARSIVATILAILTVEGGLMLIVPLTDLLLGYEPSQPFTIIALLLLLTGIAFSRIIEYGKQLTPYEAFISAAILWLLVPLFSAIALTLDTGMPIYDSFFESVSGFTGTGFTVISDVEVLRPSIQLWRSIMQWVGELGVVVFAVILLPHAYRIITRVYLVERRKLTPTVLSSAKTITLIYIVLTVAGLISYMACGMTFFEALNHILTTIATGGMSIYNDSVAPIYHRSPIIIYPILLFMVLGALNFGDLRYLITFKFSKLLKSSEFKAYLVVLLVLCLLSSMSLYLVDKVDLYHSIIYGTFHMVSGSTTTGFTLTSLSDLSDVSKALLIAGMFIGGATFSTAGGIKVLRFVIFMKNLSWSTLRTVVTIPISVRRNVGEECVTDEMLISALNFIVTYVIIDFTLAVALSWVSGTSFIDSLFEMTSAMSCVGLSVGIASASLVLPGKILLILGMYLGRIEFIQLYIIIAAILKRKTGLTI